MLLQFAYFYQDSVITVEHMRILTIDFAASEFYILMGHSKNVMEGSGNNKMRKKLNTSIMFFSRANFQTEF